jgi:hypothetical protein
MISFINDPNETLLSKSIRNSTACGANRATALS